MLKSNVLRILKKIWNHKSQIIFINILINILEKCKNESFINLRNLQEIEFGIGETKVVVNLRLFFDTIKQLEDLKIILKCLEQDINN